MIAWYGLNWIKLDYDDGLTSHLPEFPAWMLEVIVPAAFGLNRFTLSPHVVLLGTVVYQAPESCRQGLQMSFVAPILLLLLAVLRTPLFVVIALSAMIGFHGLDVDLSVISIEVYRLAEMPILSAIPLFTFAGYLLGEGNASTRLVNLTNSLLGWMPGGLAIVAIFACALFTAFTGASGITIVALGGLLYPALKQAGYLENFNLGLLTSSGSLGLLFAPSLPLILYGVVAQQMDLDQPVSISDLFLAGIFPGLLMLVMLSIYSMLQPRDRNRRESFDVPTAIKALREAKWEIPLPFLVLGGIYGGYFAVSEAAAVTAVYVLVVEVLIIREIKIAELPKIMREAMMLVGGIMIIIGVSLASTNYLIDAEVPTRMFAVHPVAYRREIDLSDTAESVSAGAGHDARYIFGYRHHRADHTADRRGLRD